MKEPGQPGSFRLSEQRWLTGVLWSAGLTLLVAAPWLLPGYLFGTDFPGPRRIDFPTELSNLTPSIAVLALAAHVVSAEIAEKALVVGAIFLMGLTAFLALPSRSFAPRAIAATVFAINPFVYGRLEYGQVFILVAYALLPWFAASVRRLVTEPGVRSALVVAVSFVVIGALDLHLQLAAALLGVVAVLAFVAARVRETAYLVRLGRSLLVAGAATVMASAYWLIPFIAGKSPEATAVGGFTLRDVAVYSAVPDSHLGLIPNLLGLYGFWAEGVGRFPSAKVFAPFWPVALAALLLLACIGAARVLVGRPGADAVAGIRRPWIVALLVVGLIALFLDIGAAESHAATIIDWLATVFPPYRGMRDSGKWAAILALVYAQLVPVGVIALGEMLRRLRWPARVGELALAAVAGIGLALPLYYGNGLLLGAHGQILASSYPSGWYQADRLLAADPRPGRALFLPWHLYMSLSFVRNTNRVIASPAPAFFSIPVVVSGDPGIRGIAPPHDAEQVALTHLVAAGYAGDWAPVLAAYDIKYVLLARESDWEAYRYLVQRPDLQLVADYGSIAVYRVALSR